MIEPMTLGVVIGVAMVLQVYFVSRIIRLDRKLNERESLIAKLRCDLASADASLFRLNDKIADLEARAPRRTEDAIVPLFPNAAGSGGN